MLERDIFQDSPCTIYSSNYSEEHFWPEPFALKLDLHMCINLQFVLISKVLLVWCRPH